MSNTRAVILLTFQVKPTGVCGGGGGCLALTFESIGAGQDVLRCLVVLQVGVHHFYRHAQTQTNISAWLSGTASEFCWALTVKVGQFVYRRAHGLLQLFDRCNNNKKIHIVIRRGEKKFCRQASFYLENQGVMLEPHEIWPAPLLSGLELHIKISGWNGWLVFKRITWWEAGQRNSTTKIGFRRLHRKPSCWCKTNLGQHEMELREGLLLIAPKKKTNPLHDFLNPQASIRFH